MISVLHPPGQISGRTLYSTFFTKYNGSMILEEEIRTAAEKIGKAIKAKRVILFGSYANGTAKEYF